SRTVRLTFAGIASCTQNALNERGWLGGRLATEGKWSPVIHNVLAIDSSQIHDRAAKRRPGRRDKRSRWSFPPDLVCNVGGHPISRSERSRTAAESPIRPRFVPDSFHMLSTGLSSAAL